jgi:hypothetical protein
MLTEQIVFTQQRISLIKAENTLSSSLLTLKTVVTILTQKNEGWHSQKSLTNNLKNILKVSACVFTILHFFRNLRTFPISKSVFHCNPFQSRVMKHSLLFCPCINYEENNVLWIRYHCLNYLKARLNKY